MLLTPRWRQLYEKKKKRLIIITSSRAVKLKSLFIYYHKNIYTVFSLRFLFSPRVISFIFLFCPCNYYSHPYPPERTRALKSLLRCTLFTALRIFFLIKMCTGCRYTASYLLHSRHCRSKRHFGVGFWMFVFSVFSTRCWCYSLKCFTAAFSITSCSIV